MKKESGLQGLTAVGKPYRGLDVDKSEYEDGWEGTLL
jgi:hypothetical protein